MNASAKIMVVDDERRICQNVQKILSHHNYEVVQAVSAEEALQKMAKESFSLLISDIVMPGMNGFELLNFVKTQWPLTKAIMMTAYASTDTAAKAIRMGALDYVLKPFTPDELRTSVAKALSGELTEVSTTVLKKQTDEAKQAAAPSDRVEIDVDMPFDRDEVAKYSGEDYVKSLGPSDMPIVKVPASETLENYCKTGKMVCDIFKKLGTTCKPGLKTGECPQQKAKIKKAAEQEKMFDAQMLIGIDQPFIYEEVVSVTGPEYVQNLNRDGMAFVPYDELKKNFSRRMAAAEELPEEMALEYPEAPAYKPILVVDDETAVNNNIRKILLKRGYHVDQAFTKADAIERIQHRAYKLVLLDLRIPGVKDLELLETIREKRPESKVIIITGYASIETAKESARMGAIDYLPKPFTPEEIRMATEKALLLAA